MEKLLKTYYSEIQEKMHERIGILEKNHFFSFISTKCPILLI